MTPLCLLALLSLLGALYTGILLITGARRIQSLRDISQYEDAPLPKVSLIVPACNEEQYIKAGVESLLGQQYSNLEILVIDDRSTDKTSDILLKLKERYPQLSVYRVDELPDGWLGKTHAMQLGAEKAVGEFLLFTDADTIMEKSTLSRAVYHVVENSLDHLSLIFKNISKGWLLNSLILDSGCGLFLLFKPWKVKEKASRCFIGVGAFNLVRKSAYQAIGGHESFKMHPIDDIMLGKKIKREGYEQDCLLGYDFVSVHWYESVGAMIEGLMKNTFAVINFRLLRLPMVVFGIIILSLFPLWGAFFAEGGVQFLCICALGVRSSFLFLGARSLNISRFTALGALITPHVSLYIVLKSAFLCLKNDGITWRGTHYSLKELKKNEPILP